MVGLLGLVTDFLCLVSAEGLPCITAVVEAIQDAGMNGILTGHATVDSSSQMAELMALSKVSSSATTLRRGYRVRTRSSAKLQRSEPVH